MIISILWKENNYCLELNRPGRCACCGRFSFKLKRAVPAYSTGVCYLCPPCDVVNDEETKSSWVDYYASRL
jgi:hypothetical protein